MTLIYVIALVLVTTAWIADLWIVGTDYEHAYDKAVIDLTERNLS